MGLQIIKWAHGGLQNCKTFAPSDTVWLGGCWTDAGMQLSYLQRMSGSILADLKPPKLFMAIWQVSLQHFISARKTLQQPEQATKKCRWWMWTSPLCNPEEDGWRCCPGFREALVGSQLFLPTVRKHPLARRLHELLQIPNFWQLCPNSFTYKGENRVLWVLCPAWLWLSVWHSLESRERRSFSGSCLDQVGLLAWGGETVLIVCRYRRAQPTVGGAIPRQMVLNHIRKPGNYKSAFEPASTWHPPWFLLYFLALRWVPYLEVMLHGTSNIPAFKFLSWLLSVIDYDLESQANVKLPLSKVILIRVFVTATEYNQNPAVWWFRSSHCLFTSSYCRVGLLR